MLSATLNNSRLEVKIVIFDRSWYNHAAVEYVMGFCNKEEHRRFLRDSPTFEGFLISQGLKPGLALFWRLLSSLYPHSPSARQRACRLS